MTTARSSLATRCEIHDAPLVPLVTPLTARELGISGPPGLERVTVRGLAAGVCPQCRAEGRPGVRVGAEARTRLGDLVTGCGRLVNARDPGGSTRLVLELGSAPDPRPAGAAPEPSGPPEAPPSRGPEPASDTGPGALPARFGFERLVAPAPVERALRRALVAVREAPTLIGWGLSDGVAPVLVFHGPPGTGKTLAAEALAFELRRPFLSVDVGGLESKFVGDSQRNVRAAFAAAERQGALLFFDEADTVLSPRLAAPSTAADQGANALRGALLQSLDRARHPVVFATNLPAAIDPAFRRRVLFAVDFPLPDEPARRAILALHLPAALPLPADEGRDALLAALAAETEGFSGADLHQLVRLAALAALAERGPATPVARADFTAAAAEVRATRAALGRPAPRVTMEEVPIGAAAGDAGAPAPDPGAVLPTGRGAADAARRRFGPFRAPRLHGRSRTSRR